MMFPETGALLNGVGYYLDMRAQYAEAEPLFQRAIAIDEKMLGPEHPNLAMLLNNLALLYSDQGRYEQAEPLYQRAIAMYKKTFEPHHPHQGFTPQLVLAHLDVESCSIGGSQESQACVQAGLRLPAPGRCDGNSARMRISGLLNNAAAIASFGPALEPLQRIPYASLNHLAAKCCEYPPPPTWRESEVSAILHATGDGVDSGAGGGLMVDDADT